MKDDDPRHGTQAGHSQHRRDNETPCAPCIQGDLLAGRRRRKRKTQGHIYALPVGPELHARLTELRDEGATYQQIADWAGVTFRTSYAVITGGPEERVYTETHRKLTNIRPQPIVTNTGLTRRVRALQRLGYSIPHICRETGLSETWMRIIRDGLLTGSPSHHLRQTIVDTYNRLHMTLPPEDTVGQRKGVTRARNAATKNGWPPPLAYESIDNPEENPADWEYRRAYGNREEDLRELVQGGANIHQACRELHRSREALEVWCRRYGLTDQFLILTARATTNENQYQVGAA